MIPHFKLFLNDSDLQEVIEVMRSGYIGQGRKVSEFESAIASYIGVKGCVAVSSGTSGLHLALLSLGIKEGDEVVLPTYVCTSPLNAIYYTGAEPVLVDIEESDFNLSVRDVKKKLSKKTKAIIVPHMFGNEVDMEHILEMCVPVIEDCAHSIGAKVGGVGVLSIFSFYATKMITCGEGGMVCSNDERLLSKIHDMRDYDEKDDFKVRFNYKMTDMEAALGISQLKKLPVFIKRRKEIAEIYNKAFGMPSRDGVFYRYIIRVESDVESCINKLKVLGVECKRPVYKPLHQYLGLVGFPVAEKVYKSAISIPLYPALKDDEVAFIVKAIKQVICRGGP